MRVDVPSVLPKLLVLALGVLVSGCGARYSVQSRTSTNRNGDRNNGGIIVIVNDATAADPTRPGDMMPIEDALAPPSGQASIELLVSKPSASSDPDGDLRLRFELSNPSDRPIARLDLRVVVEAADQPAVFAERQPLDSPLLPGAVQPTELTLPTPADGWHGLQVRAFGFY